MTPQQLVGFAVKIFSLWILVLTFQAVGLIIELRRMLGTELIVIYAAPFGFFILAVFLWVFPMVAAHKLLPRAAGDKDSAQMPLELGAAGCVIVGMLAILKSLPMLTMLIGVAESYIDDIRTAPGLFLHERIPALISFMHFALGWFLIKKSRFIVSRVWRGDSTG